MEFKNNSQEMKTEVETYVIEETASLIYDNDELEEWNDIVNELGLEGQKTIVKPEKSPIPFMYLKTNMVNMFETLCPRKVDISKYDITPIPTEILRLAAMSKREEYFDKVQIWYDDKSPDPVCVGLKVSYYGYMKEGTRRGERIENLTKAEYEQMKLQPNWDWGSSDTPKIWLIGKWADVKQSFEVLRERAKQRWISEQTTSYEAQIKQYNQYIDNLKTDCNRKFD